MKIRNKAKLKLFGEVIFLNYFLVAFVEVCIMSHTHSKDIWVCNKSKGFNDLYRGVLGGFTIHVEPTSIIKKKKKRTR
jgi:hypothetical protein